jgi:hypothetical protein
VPWFQEWIRHGPDDPYWQATDHRDNVGRMPPVVYLQGGWYDFFLPGMLADHAVQTAGRLLIGPSAARLQGWDRRSAREAAAAIITDLELGHWQLLLPNLGPAHVTFTSSRPL